MAYRRPERVVKSMRNTKKEKQVKRIRLYMIVVLVAVCISLLTALLLTLIHLIASPEVPEESSASSVSSSVISRDDSLPVYEDDLNLLLVNSKRRLPEGWQHKLTEYKGVRVDRRILPALEQMLKDAEADGIDLILADGYISVSEQDVRYSRLIEELRAQGYSQVVAEDKAQNTFGKGGYSESQTGLSVTFTIENGDFKSSEAYQWLLDHSVNYGFIQRFPENKISITGRDFDPGCYRYVGTEHALNIRRLSMCLEEYSSYMESQRE